MYLRNRTEEEEEEEEGRRGGSFTLMKNAHSLQQKGCRSSLWGSLHGHTTILDDARKESDVSRVDALHAVERPCQPKVKDTIISNLANGLVPFNIFGIPILFPIVSLWNPNCVPVRFTFLVLMINQLDCYKPSKRSIINTFPSTCRTWSTLLHPLAKWQRYVVLALDMSVGVGECLLFLKIWVWKLAPSMLFSWMVLRLTDTYQH